MYEFWYDYVKPKNDKKPKICYMDTKSFIIHIQTDGIYNDIAKMLKQDLTLQILKQTDHYLKEIITKVIQLIKFELGG